MVPKTDGTSLLNPWSSPGPILVSHSEILYWTLCSELWWRRHRQQHVAEMWAMPLDVYRRSREWFCLPNSNC